MQRPSLAADPARFARAVITNGTSLLFVVQARCRCSPAGSAVFFLPSRGGRVDAALPTLNQCVTDQAHAGYAVRVSDGDAAAVHVVPVGVNAKDNRASKGPGR